MNIKLKTVLIIIKKQLKDVINTAQFFQSTLKNNFNSHKCKLKDVSEYKNIVCNLEVKSIFTMKEIVEYLNEENKNLIQQIEG